NDVAYNLPPFRIRIRDGKQPDPSRAGNDEKDCQRMLLKGFYDRTEPMMGRLAAFRRTRLVKEFGGQDGDQESCPVGNGVAEKRTEMGRGVRAAVKDNPGCQDRARHQTE